MQLTHPVGWTAAAATVGRHSHLAGHLWGLEGLLGEQHRILPSGLLLLRLLLLSWGQHHSCSPVGAALLGLLLPLRLRAAR